MTDFKNTEYKNVLIAGAWANPNGNISSMPVDAKTHDTLVRVFEQGGKFLIRKRSDESIGKSKNPDTAPTYFIEFVPAEEVAKHAEARQQRVGTNKYL